MAEYAEYIDRKLLVPDVDFDGDGNEELKNKIKSQLDRTRSVNMRYVVRGKWEILEDYKDGTSRCRCTNCKNTYRLSKQTIYGFSFCPRCSSYNREYDGYKSNKWIEEIRIAGNEQTPVVDVVARSEYEKLRLVNLDLAETNKGLLAEHEQLEKLRSKINAALEEIEKQKKITFEYEGESDLGVAIRIIKKHLGEVKE